METRKIKKTKKKTFFSIKNVTEVVFDCSFGLFGNGNTLWRMSRYFKKLDGWMDWFLF